MLIDLHYEAGSDRDSSPYPTPVVASMLQPNQTTSADVHLYSDPLTYGERTPLLYADCEGFTGGETLPVGAIENRRQSLDPTAFSPRLTPGKMRELYWAKTPEKRAREFVVANLYPRILYTFSDVVVFVLRNAKTFESTVFQPLIEWGVASLEKSINQPTLPHAIIVLNDTDLAISSEEWEVDSATQNLLEANRDCLNPRSGSHYFIQLAKEWRAKGKAITDILDLIQCYYSTFKVVRIPTKGRYQRMYEQVKKLHRLMSESCASSFITKRQARMLATSEELSLYLQSAFDHFAGTIDEPFNFIKVSLQINPIPDNFGGHILQLARAIQSNGRRRESHWIFEKIHYLVASSVMLDCVRHRKGMLHL